MRRMIASLLLVAASALPATAADVTPVRAAALINTVIDQVIIPGYEQLEAKTAGLAGSLNGLCAAPTNVALEDARAHFAASAAAWAQVEFIRFGPVMVERRLERIHFWPDQKGIGLRQIQALLANEDATATDTAPLAGKSVAVQGLPALEYLLHGTGAEALAGTGDAYRCRYAQAIAANLNGIAGELVAAWRATDGYRRTWTTPGAANPIYRSTGEALLEFIEIFTNGFLIMAEQKLEPVLGKSIGEARGRRAELWRSELSAAMLRSDTAGLTALLERSEVAALLTGDVNTSWIVPAMLFELHEVQTKLDEIEPPISEAVTEPVARAKLEYIVIVLKSLGQMTAAHLAASLGLQVGFNALDGD